MDRFPTALPRCPCNPTACLPAGVPAFMPHLWWLDHLPGCGPTAFRYYHRTCPSPTPPPAARSHAPATAHLHAPARALRTHYTQLATPTPRALPSCAATPLLRAALRRTTHGTPTISSPTTVGRYAVLRGTPPHYAAVPLPTWFRRSACTARLHCLHTPAAAASPHHTTRAFAAVHLLLGRNASYHHTAPGLRHRVPLPAYQVAAITLHPVPDVWCLVCLVRDAFPSSAAPT